MKFDKKAFIEAVKEPLRILLLAVIPFAIAWASEFSYEWAGVVVVVLKFIDKYMHEIAPKGEAGGLTRF